MKGSILTIMALLVVGFASTSCKKDYTCTCTEQISGSAVSNSFPIKKSALDDAKDLCDARETEGVTTCTLL